jgi:hypothetical protein
MYLVHSLSILHSILLQFEAKHVHEKHLCWPRISNANCGITELLQKATHTFFNSRPRKLAWKPLKKTRNKTFRSWYQVTRIICTPESEHLSQDTQSDPHITTESREVSDASSWWPHLSNKYFISPEGTQVKKQINHSYLITNTVIFLINCIMMNTHLRFIKLFYQTSK